MSITNHLDSEKSKIVRMASILCSKQLPLAQSQVNIQNMQDTQAINAENMAESLRIQREEAQRAQRLQTEGANLTAHHLDQQTKVGLVGAQALG
ncbi:hypothetical protein FACS1894161_5180 [Spirochaetia bacterium]|nr:hypothetical protein FACS1894161_5180 [Spirochaetia bacterium]